jgi:hypothetical protein
MMTKESLIAAIREFEFFPTPAVLVEFLHEHRISDDAGRHGRTVPVQHWPYRGPLGGTEYAWWQTHDIKTGDEIPKRDPEAEIAEIERRLRAGEDPWRFSGWQ